MDEILHKIIQKKGIDSRNSDRVRFDQVLQGACPKNPIILKFLPKGSKSTLTYPELVKEVRKEETLLKAKNQDKHQGKQMLKQKKGPTCPIQVKEYFSEDNDESIYETGVKLSKTPSQVPTKWDNARSAGSSGAHLELNKTAMQVMTNVQQVVTPLLLRKKDLGEVKSGSTPPPSRKKCHSCGETGNFRAQSPRRRTCRQRKNLQGVTEASIQRS